VEYIILGNTDLLISRTAFGAQSLEKLEKDDALSLVKLAYDEGINFFDTSHLAPKSEALLGEALRGFRDSVILATKTELCPPQELLNNLEESLVTLQTDHIDLYQLEDPSFIPLQGAPDGIYDTLKNLQDSGKIRAIGIASSDMDIARKTLDSKLYNCIQFPFNMLSDPKVESLYQDCFYQGMGFIAMQPLNGGIVSNIPLAFGYLNQFEHVIPLWGARSNEELKQILYFSEHPPIIDEKFHKDVESLRMRFS